MNRTIFCLLAFLCISTSQLFSQVRPTGIKLLAKDRDTGAPFRGDTLYASINDSAMYKIKTDTSGYYYFNLIPGTYSVMIGKIGYQAQRMNGMMVGESKTSYLTISLSNSDGKKNKKKKAKTHGVKLKMKE